jgi:type IV secretion system protein VirB8
MFGKKKDTQNIENAVAKSINYEVTIADIARKSEKRAWFVAWSAILMSLALAGGYYYMLPLKEKVPYLVMADAYTGTSTVARLENNFGDNSITASEALNKSNVAQFVLARESYDNSTVGNRNQDTVYAMSGSAVRAGYNELLNPVNPDQPFKLYGSKASVRVKILSITLAGTNDISELPKVATVRFQRILYDKEKGTSRPMDGRVATLEFVYKNNLKMEEYVRLLNPLGFQVTSYNVVSDSATAPPLQGEAAPVFFGPAPQPTQQPVQQLQAPALDAQGNPMLPTGEPVPSVPQPLAPGAQQPGVPQQQLPPGAQQPAAPSPQPTQNPNPTNNANGAATR